METTRTAIGAWMLAAGAGCAVVLLGWSLVEVPPISAPASAAKLASALRPVGLVQLERQTADVVLREEAMLRDPAPLFLPTRWSAGENALATEAWRDPGISFGGYEPKLKVAETGLVLQMPAPVAAPSRPVEAFALERSKRPLLGFGQTEANVTPLPSRRGFLHVSAAGDGERLIAQPLEDIELPSDAAWQPLEFIVAIDAGGVIRPPVLTESSRVAAVDAYFQDYLVKTLHIGERLGPGLYRVGIGP
ncbi:MAG TPA: hypothetical protein VEQ65_06665 [Opitutus sp.]|nr:hypothetical protein [Opitutus sp.]